MGQTKENIITKWRLVLEDEKYQELVHEEQAYLHNLGLQARYYEEKDLSTEWYKKDKENQKRLFNLKHKK